MSCCQTKDCVILNPHGVSEHYCSAFRCKFANTHNISGHLCRICKQFGHDPFQCGSDVLTSNVVEIPIKAQCAVNGCQHKDSHTSDGHRCRLCSRHGHGPKECGYASLDEILSVFPDQIHGKIYIATHEGMGCIGFNKRDSPSDTFSTFFMHSDSWGQYGPRTSKVPALREFLGGYRPFRIVDNPGIENNTQ